MSSRELPLQAVKAFALERPLSRGFRSLPMRLLYARYPPFRDIPVRVNDDRSASTSSAGLS